MIRIRIFLLILVVSVNDLIAQQCNVSEEINPLNDSLCWTIGTKDSFEFLIDKNLPGENWVSLSIVSPGKLAASIGDSAWLLLDNDYVIKLSNSKNFRSTTKTFKALYVGIDYYLVRFMSKINSDDIIRMTSTKVKKIFLNLNPTFNLNYEISTVKKHPFVLKTSTYTLMDNHVAVRINKIPKRQQKDILNTAVCADKYIQ